jgi:hypothetical protein
MRVEETNWIKADGYASQTEYSRILVADSTPV